MGKKCCVYRCKTNYSSDKSSGEIKVSVFRFPKEEGEKQTWVKAIPNANLTVTKDTVVCELHWPSGFEKISKNGKFRPRDPPSVWPHVPPCQVPTPAPPLRTTQRSSSSVRNTEEDQLAAFLASDTVTFCEIKHKLLTGERNLPAPVIAYIDEDVLNVQSRRLLNGVPVFRIKISQNLSFKNFHLGVRATSLSLSKNRITA